MLSFNQVKSAGSAGNFFVVFYALHLAVLGIVATM